MADIHIEREHALGLAQARKLAFKWAKQAEEKFDIKWSYEEGQTQDLISFSRSGAKGTLAVTRDGFELNAKLSFLLGSFKHKIEAEIAQTLDSLIVNKPGAGEKRGKHLK